MVYSFFRGWARRVEETQKPPGELFQASLTLHCRGSWTSYLFTSGFERVFGVLHIIEVLYVVTVRVIVSILAVFY